MHHGHYPAFLGLLCIQALVFGRAAQADDIAPPAELAELRQKIEKEAADGKLPGVSVALVRDNELIWAEGFGYADLAGKVPATSNTIYRLASISKPITATALMKLVDRGLIDLDAPANQYLPGPKLRTYLGSADEMTIRRIANHTSGLPIHYNFFYDAAAPPSMDETIRRYGFASKAPGSRYEYSNLGYGILDYITQTVSEVPWPQFMEQEVYDPLGMQRTSNRIRPGRESDAAVQYERDLSGRFVPVGHYGFDHPGASVIVSSVQDMARFARMHMNAGELDGVRILSPEAAQQMQVQTATSDPRSGYAIGWGISTYRGRRMVSHSGGMPGVSTVLRLFPDSKSAVIAFTNCDQAIAMQRIVGWLGQALFPEDQSDSKSATQQKSDDQSAEFDLKGTWKGTLVHYDGDLPLAVHVISDKTIHVRLGNGPLAPLTDVNLSGRGLRGATIGRLPTQSAYHGNNTIRFQLRPEGADRLIGTAVTFGDGYYALAHWVDVRREGTSETSAEAEPQ